MTPAEALIHYSAENAAIIYVLGALVIVSGALAANFFILYLLQKMKIRNWRKHQAYIETELIARQQQILILRDQVGDVEFLKKEMRRYDGIRDKAENRLKEQNALVQSLEDQVAFYKIMIDHIDLPVISSDPEKPPKLEKKP